LTNILNSEDSLPLEPLISEGGYFLLADVSKCKQIIPQKYLLSHDYLSKEDQELI
jgi:aspartate/methionine/tyrosine aminotransferase